MENGFRDTLINELKSYFGADQKRIQHALDVLGYAEEILETQHVDEKKAVIAAAILHDIGIREAEVQYQSSSATFQEQLGPGIAKEILTRMGHNGNMVEHVCEMIAHHHHPKRYFEQNPDAPPLPFHILLDADRLVNTKSGEYKPGDPDKYFTEAAVKIAGREKLIKEPGAVL